MYTNDWRVGIPLIQREEVVFDLGRFYSNDSLNCVIMYPLSAQEGPKVGIDALPIGPMLLTNYRFIHMKKVTERITKKSLFKTKVSVVNRGCSFGLGIPHSHVDRLNMGRSRAPGWLHAFQEFTIFIISDFQDKYRDFYSIPLAEGGWERGPEGQIRLCTVLGRDLPSRDGVPLTPTVIIKKFVDQYNKLLTTYMAQPLTECQYCRTRLQDDMLICSFCGAPVRART